MVGVPKVTLSVRMVGARINAVEPRVLRLEDGDDRILHRQEFGPAVKAAADTGLVGYKYDRNALAIRRADHRRRPGQDRDIFDAAEVIDFLDDNPVTIEEQRRAAAPGMTADL